MNSTKQQIAALASKMGVSAKDLTGFLVCLSSHTSKGATIEQAIAAHYQTTVKTLNVAHKATNAQRRHFVTSTFFPFET